MNPARLVWAGSALYAASYFLLGWDRFASYHSGADLGLFVQTISSAFDGGFRNTLEGGNHFTYHFSPILYLCAPFLLLAHSPLALIALQAIACALVAPALFGIARRRTDAPTALAIAAVAWVYPPLAGVTFTDFHENGFVVAATAWLLWALDARRLALGALFAAILLATKEDQALILAALGIGIAVVFARTDRARAWFGLGLIAISLAVFVLYFTVVRPLAGATVPWDPLHFYALGGAQPRGPTTPLFSLGRLTYLLEVFGPLLFVPLFSPLVVAAIPGLAECLLSRESLTYTMGQHYAAVWIGYVLVAFAFAAPRFGRWSRFGPIGACLVVLALASPTHWGHFLGPRTPHDAVLDRFVASVPRDASVGTHDEIYAHLGFVPRAQIGLEPLPQLALFDRSYHSTSWDTAVGPEFERLLAGGAYRVVRKEAGVILAERRRN